MTARDPANRSRALSQTSPENLYSRWPERSLQTTLKIGLVLVVMLRAASAHGQAAQDLLRLNFTPLVGYRTTMTFVDNQETGTTPAPRLVLESSPSYGGALGVKLNAEDVIEFRWARQSTHLRVENVSAPFRQAATLDEFHGDFTHEYILRDWPDRVRPFIMASVGATRIGGSGNSSFTRFSFGIGAGLKAFANRHLGIRIQGEWMPIVVDPQVDFVCGGGCVIHFKGNLRSQGEFAIGPILRF